MTTTGPHEEGPHVLLRPGGPMKASISVIRLNGTDVVRKDYKSSGIAFRTLVGKFLVRRETKTYGLLHGVKGIPHLGGPAGRNELLLEFIKGMNTRAVPPLAVNDQFFAKLEVLLSTMLARRVVHLDIAKNIIVADSGEPFLIDFEASLVLPEWPAALSASITSKIMERYRREILVLKDRLRPDLMSDDDVKIMRKRLSSDRIWTVGVRMYRGLAATIAFVLTGRVIRWQETK